LPYTCVSSRKPKDFCQNEHPDRDSAQKCLLEHQNECRRNGKVSDRVIIPVSDLSEVEDLEIL
jgi:hypothetical protein